MKSSLLNLLVILFLSGCDRPVNEAERTDMFFDTDSSIGARGLKIRIEPVTNTFRVPITRVCENCLKNVGRFDQ